jgi:predicted site-specific integrase-resolvase
MTESTHIGTTKAAVLLRVNPKTIVRWTEAGKLHPVKTDLGNLYPVEEVERLARERHSALVAA